MTSKIETSQPSPSTHECCGNQVSNQKAVADAKQEAPSSSSIKRSAPAEANKSCCHEENSWMPIK